MISQNGNNNAVEENGSYGGMPPVMGWIPESLLNIIWRGRWIILLTTVVALSVAFVYLAKATPIYTSSSRIYVEQSGPKVFTETEEGIMTQSKNYLYTQAALLKSTSILADALDTPGIKHIRTFAGMDNPIAYLKKNVDVFVGKKDDLINVSFNSPYPADAAQVANAMVDSYITYHATRKRSTSAEVLKILRAEKDKRSTELSEKLTAMMDYRKQNEALVFEGAQGNIVIGRLERLSEVLTEAQLATIESKSAYESVKEMVSDPARLKKFIEAQRAKGIYASEGNGKASLESKLEQLEYRLADRLRQVKASHPAVVALESEITNIKSQIAELDTKSAQAERTAVDYELALAEQQYIAAKEKENEIAKYYDEQRKQALFLNEQLAQYTILQSDWEQTKKLCDILDDRIKELNVTEDVGALNISILEVARPANTPSEPQKARYMGIALVLGLMLGCGLALLRDWMDQRLRSAEEITAILGIPVLGVVPTMSRKQGVVQLGQKVHKESDSRAAEAYRTVRTAVFFGAPKNEAKTVLVTSPAPADGKTTLVSNLAITMAQAGQKTLIVDADFRKPMQHKIFELNHEDTGLSSTLAGMTTSKDAIQPTEIEGLEVLSCGPHVPNPSEMLNSDSFAQLLELLSDRYDRIIIDSPPVMPVTDAQILSAICDITLLVLRAEKSTRKISQQAQEGLLSVGARILGAVVNDVPKKGRYGYYSGYGYYYSHYGYGYDHREKKKTSDKQHAVVVKGSDRFTRSDD